MSMNPRKGILSLKISDQNMLYHSFMPFLKNGGLFIPTNKPYQMGEEVFILLTLLDEPEKNTCCRHNCLDYAERRAGQSGCGHRRAL